MNKIKLFCLPYAGGTANIYIKWRRYLLPEIELIPLELAGRGKRIGDLLYSDMNEAIEDIYQTIKPHLDGTPYAFWGHSMGSLLAYECTHKILEQQHKGPETIFFSGKNPPHIKVKKIRHLLPNREFIDEVFSMGGTSKELIEQEDLLDFFIPILRADFRLVETYQYCRKKKFLFDIAVLNGIEDEMTTKIEIEEWTKYTEKQCDIYQLNGAHFFIHDQMNDVINIINNKLRQYTLELARC
ncbi:thioesterase domain-containing protein [Bacillus cereus]|nr:thioesterase domain-containing protein [Bacillus cereus]